MTEMIVTMRFSRLLDQAPGLAKVTHIALGDPSTLLLVVVVALILHFVPNTTVRLGGIWLDAVLIGVV